MTNLMYTTVVEVTKNIHYTVIMAVVYVKMS